MSLKSPDPAPPGPQRPIPEPTSTGKIPFSYSENGLKGETAYFLWGSLSSSKTPLIALHGGPGIPHQYILPICLVQTDYDIPVLMYDQIGCGASTAFPDKKGDEKFWTPELFMAELDNVISHLGIKTYDLLGQSWGGMLAGQYALRQPKGLRKLIVEGGPDDIPAYARVTERFKKQLPQEMQDTIARCEKDGTTDSEEYKNAEMYYYSLHLCRKVPFPDELMQSFEQVEKDPTVYFTMMGPNEFNATGNLRDWSIRDRLHEITQETVPGGLLLVNGYFDTVQDETTDGFFYKTKCKTKWIRYALSGHCGKWLLEPFQYPRYNADPTSRRL